MRKFINNKASQGKLRCGSAADVLADGSTAGSERAASMPSACAGSTATAAPALQPASSVRKVICLLAVVALMALSVFGIGRTLAWLVVWDQVESTFSVRESSGSFASETILDSEASAEPFQVTGSADAVDSSASGNVAASGEGDVTGNVAASGGDPADSDAAEDGSLSDVSDAASAEDQGK